jgi:hypothetical protein
MEYRIELKDVEPQIDSPQAAPRTFRCFGCEKLITALEFLEGKGLCELCYLAEYFDTWDRKHSK